MFCHFGLAVPVLARLRALIVLVAAVFALCGLPALADAQTLKKVTFRLDYLPSGYHAPLFYALANGYYRDVGIDLQLSDGKGTNPALQSVAAGNDMIVLANYSTMLQSIGQGMPVVAVGGLIQKLPDSVVSLQGSGINTPKDLEGKTMSIPPASAVFKLFPAFTAAAGIDITKIKMIQTDSATVLTALLQGQVQFTTGWAFTDARKVASVKPINPPMLMADYGVNVLGVGFVVTRDTAAKEGDTIRKFLAATAKGYAAAEKDPAAAVDAMVAARPTLDRGLMLEQLSLLPPFLQTERSEGHPFGWMALEDWQQTYDLSKKYFGMVEDVDAKTAFTNDFVPAKAGL